jgi:hypothetical protein
MVCCKIAVICTDQLLLSVSCYIYIYKSIQQNTEIAIPLFTTSTTSGLVLQWKGGGEGKKQMKSMDVRNSIAFILSSKKETQPIWGYSSSY